MAIPLWTMLCARAMTDSQTNSLSLIDVIEEISIRVDANTDVTKPLTEPVLVPLPVVLVSLFTRSNPGQPEKTTGQAYFEEPAGFKYPPTRFDIDLTHYIRIRCLVNANGLPIRESGTHHFRVELETSPGHFDEVAKLPVQVTLFH